MQQEKEKSLLHSFDFSRASSNLQATRPDYIAVFNGLFTVPAQKQSCPCNPNFTLGNNLITRPYDLDGFSN